MKYLIILLSLFMFQGCLYFNDRGVSGNLYDNCHNYYDGNGNYIQKCDGNIIDYDEAKEGVVAIKNEIVENINSITETKKSGINIEELSLQKQYELINKNPNLIKEQIDPKQCPCK